MTRLGESGFIAYRSVDAIYDVFIGSIYFTMARIVEDSERPVERLISDFFFHLLLAFGFSREDTERMIAEIMAIG